MNKVTVEVEEYYQNYCWRDYIDKLKCDRKQQISLQVTGARNRGNFVVNFDTVNCLAPLKPHLTNYFFEEPIAELEIYSWIKLISDTVNDTLINIEECETANTFTSENSTLSLKVGCKKLTFKTNENKLLYFIDAKSKDDLLVIDRHDMFPRYYFTEKSAMSEVKLWIKARKVEFEE